MRVLAHQPSPDWKGGGAVRAANGAVAELWKAGKNCMVLTGL